MTEELKPIDVSKYTVTESGNVIRTDNKETLKNALERITDLEKENAQLKKDYEETEALLIKQIEATLKLYKENEELKGRLKNACAIINRLMGAVKILNNTDTELTDINAFLKSAEEFVAVENKIKKQVEQSISEAKE